MADGPACVLGRRVVAQQALGGGCLFDVRAVDLDDGRRVVVKSGSRGLPGQLPLEARMLGDLAAAGVPVPLVLEVDDSTLVLSWVDHDGGSLDTAGRRQLAIDLARLHANPQRQFGYDYDTVIGALPQANPTSDRWLPFFGTARLDAQARAARAEGVLDRALHKRIETLIGQLDRFLIEPPHPSLLHGDLWSGNVLTRAGAPVAWIDPAIYRGHPEIELAFACLFGPLDTASLNVYAAEGQLEPDFKPTRCAIYQLYPLLVHLRLFGRSYARPIAERLSSCGL